LEVLLIGTCYVYLGKNDVPFDELFSLKQGKRSAGLAVPMLLVGYVTTMLSGDIYHAFSLIKTTALT